MSTALRQKARKQEAAGKRSPARSTASPGSRSPYSAESRLADVSPPARVLSARAGDHHAIHRLLVALLQEPSTAEFQAQLEDPCYEPSDRLIVTRDQQVVAHAHLMKREIHFGRRTLPIVVLNDFVMLPELHASGIDGTLLGAIHQRIADEGAPLGVLRTSQPEFFRARGWAVCLRHSYARASAREILSQLREIEPVKRNPLRRERSSLNIRIWRHVEQAALVRLYAEHAAGAYGSIARNDAYWRWLISRRGYDRIYVAIDGPDKIELDDTLAPIVGYAVMREGRILELVTSPHCRQAARDLLARACRDAIESDLHYVQLDAPPHDPLHAVFTAAGGEQHYHEAENGELSMVHLVNPVGFLQLLGSELVERAKRAQLELPCEMGLQLGGEKYGLTIGTRRIKLARGRVGRSYLECDTAALSQLLLGHVDVRQAVQRHRLHCSTRVATETAAVLFPQLPIWRPPWDEFPA